MRRKRKEGGSVTLLETAAVGTLGVLLLSAYWTMSDSTAEISRKDICVVEAEKNGLDLMAANPACPTPTPAS